jgi:NADPH:quinone reductase
LKAIRVHEYGGPEVLRLEDVEPPQPGPGHALVKIEACGLNYLDVQYRKGLLKAGLPLTIGSEASGTVSAIGSGVTEVKVGDRVAYAMVIGAYAEFAVVPAAKLVPIPTGVDFNVVAAVMLQGMTAHYLTHSTFALQPGDTALVHAAAGGVGLLITQVARKTGATVIATVGSEAKAELARQAGANEIINYSTQDFEAEVKRMTGGRGVDVVYDSVGRDTFDKSMNCLRPRGYLVAFGFSSGPVTPVDPLTLGVKGSLFLTRPGLNQYIATRAELLMRANAIFEWLAAGALKVRIDNVLPLADAAKAHEDLEARRTTGKVLFLPPSR